LTTVDWVTISQVATAAGTTVLAVATFSSIRASKRSTDLAERSLRAGLRPLLVPSREDDPTERVRFGDGQIIMLEGHAGQLVVGENDHAGCLYMGISLRNGGAGIAVIQAWQVIVSVTTGASSDQPDPDTFRPQQRDFYVPAGDTGFWQGAIRDPEDPMHARLVQALDSHEELVMIDLLYGDHEGGQRTITRFRLFSPQDEKPRAEVLRVWVLDGVDPRRA
jgi:hypothetical protein